MNTSGGRELDTASLNAASLASKDRTLWDGGKGRGSARDDAIMTVDGTLSIERVDGWVGRWIGRAERQGWPVRHTPSGYAGIWLI